MARLSKAEKETQKTIMDKYGPAYIAEHRRIRCGRCQSNRHCQLMPITLEGTTCPYFMQDIMNPNLCRPDRRRLPGV